MTSRNLILASCFLVLCAPGAALAQAMCSTQLGACVIAMNAGAPGSPCYCMTAAGPIAGITIYGASMNPQALPQFCCTPAGRLGPFMNTSIPVGAPCVVPSPFGQMIAGQACY
jgi:hypothetical protein